MLKNVGENIKHNFLHWSSFTLRILKIPFLTQSFTNIFAISNDYCIVLRLLTIKPTYFFIKPTCIYFFRARYVYAWICITQRWQKMVVERPPFNGDQNPQKYLLFFEKWWKMVKESFNIFGQMMILKLIKIKIFNFSL